ncbi:UNVERIFIED_CONTAM: VPS10 domain-containing receptor SorCS2, partial [Gekko kuhli]
MVLELPCWFQDREKSGETVHGASSSGAAQDVSYASVLPGPHDYGFERSALLKSESSTCFADFWFHPETPPEDCLLGHEYRSSTGYRKVISNVCEGGVDLQQNVSRHPCPATAPKQLRISIKGDSLAVKPGESVAFVVKQDQGDIVNTKYQVDHGDGFKAMYVNLTLADEPIQHRYENPGVYRVSVTAENAAGREEAVVFVQVH